MSTLRPRRVAAALGLVAVVVLGLIPTRPADARSEASPEQELADRYAPVIMVKAQDGPCDADGEQYEPTAVDIVLDNPQVVLRQVGTGDPVTAVGPSAADLFDVGEGFYLDFPGGSLEPGCIYEQDYRRYAAGRPNVVYAHLASQPDEPGLLALQYWFYWYYNDWNNTHESDWEGIQLVFEADSAAEALAGVPVSVGYAQHEGGERADWDAAKLETQGDHPVVYASAGSHASYFGSALYLGRSGSEGFGCDNTDGPSRTIEPEVVLLPDEVTDADDPLAWLAFEGRWGERHGGPFNGPTGPATKDRWTEPITWQDDLRSSSVVVPSGDSFGTSVINAFCGVVEWGSGLFADLQVSPVGVLVTLAVAAGLVRFLVRRTVWSPADPLPLRTRRRLGQLLFASLRLYRSRWWTFAWIGLVYLPISVLGALLVVGLRQLPVIRPLLDLAGRTDGISILYALAVGGLVNLVAFAIVSAAVAGLVGDLDAGGERGTYRRVVERWRSLGAALARAFLVVGALTVSIVGIPWAIRQLVRYQLFPQVVMLEDRHGRRALDRSTALVRGRWWATAWIVLVLQAAVAGLGLALGLVILVLVTSLPLWAFSILTAFVHTLIVPFAAAVLTLLYGDRVAAVDEAEPDQEPARVGR